MIRTNAMDKLLVQRLSISWPGMSISKQICHPDRPGPGFPATQHQTKQHAVLSSAAWQEIRIRALHPWRFWVSSLPQLAAGKLAARDDKGEGGASIWCDGSNDKITDVVHRRLNLPQASQLLRLLGRRGKLSQLVCCPWISNHNERHCASVQIFPRHGLHLAGCDGVHPLQVAS
jgi:hypothetical protein